MVEKTTQDYKDAAKEMLQTRASAASDEPDPVFEPHRKAKEHDLTTHNQVVNEDSDGTLGTAIAGGIINTGEADAKLASYSSTGKKKEKKKDDLLRFIHMLQMLEDQIERLKKEVAVIRKQIKELGEQIATKEELLKALREGRELTEAQKRLAEEYRDNDGNIDQDALLHDIKKDKDEFQYLNEKADEIDQKIEDKTNLLNSLDENTPPEKIDKILKEVSDDQRNALLGKTENQEAKEAAIDKITGGNEKYEAFLEEGLLGDDDLKFGDFDVSSSTSVASLVSKTPIKVENITVAYNNAASGEDNNTLPENEIVVKAENVLDHTV